jgi:hypothetical protein
VVPLSRLYKNLHPLDLSDKVGAPFRPSVIYAPIISALSFTQSCVLLTLVVSRMMLLSVKDVSSFVGIGVSYISVFLIVVILAYTRSTVV